MTSFITENFLLQNDRAIELYHQYARDMPIIDYHCHLPPEQIAADHRFDNISQAWLAGDHYKWRAMRAAGVDEQYCTGDADDWAKFQQWAATVPLAIRNPLYHWTHLELNRPFGINDRLLSPETAEGIYKETGEMLRTPEFSAQGIMRQMNVVLVCTTDDPIDTLEYHQQIAADPNSAARVLPTFRPDKALKIESPVDFNAWVDQLAEISGIEVNDDYDKFLEALTQRHDFFHQCGCRLSDHGLDEFPIQGFNLSEVASTFRQVRRGNRISGKDARKYQAAVLFELALMNHKKDWTQQFHIGAQRNNNSRMFEQLGPDSGFDSMGDLLSAESMSRFFDQLDRGDQLARTIIYNLNPIHNDLMATMIGNFQGGGVRGKMQFGSGWWFLDQRDGMLAQLETLSNHGLLSLFVGMLTDSRSLLSYPRHEYFRRILCNLLGEEMEQGLVPDEPEMIGKMVKDICYNNAATYFGFDLDVME